MNKRFTTNLLLLLFAFLPTFSFAGPAPKGGEYYQITVYHFTTPEQQQSISQYLKDAYLPAMHRLQVKTVGVFTAMANDTSTDKRIYVIMPLKSLDQLTALPEALAKDNEFQTNGKAYLDAVYTTPPYTRLERIVLKAFPLAPFLNLPQLKGPVTEKVFELRSYESATEKIFINKVHMFNEGGEIDLFKSLNFNAVFYASVIAGAHMPNLMYMTSFESMADRDAHWKSFVDSPVWKKTSALPEYQHNVSHTDIIFLHATDFSDM